MRLEGARPILATVIDCYWRKIDLPPSTDIAKRFYVSPSQARAVLKYAQGQGFIRLAERGRLLDAQVLADAYLSSLRRFLAFVGAHGLQLQEIVFTNPAISTR
jgi:hypothetical protein